MAACLRCVEPMPEDAVMHKPLEFGHTGEVGWYSRDDITYCPTCMHALLRGLPPIGARSTQ